MYLPVLFVMPVWEKHHDDQLRCARRQHTHGSVVGTHGRQHTKHDVVLAELDSPRR
jgi:hypothetical protein